MSMTVVHKRLSLVAAMLLLAGCSSASKLLNDVTGETDTVLPGKRESVMAPGANTDAPVADVGQPVVIPAAQTNASWSQPGGSPTNALGNLALGPSLTRSWASNAGEGSNDEGHVIASPIVANGAVYALDSEAKVTALSASGGQRRWRTSLVPERKETKSISGGGLASEGGRLYATTPYGEVLALDASSGAILWRKKVEAPIRAAPTVADGTIYFTGSSNEVFALKTGDGSELWKYQGTGGHASIVSSTSPAVANGFVVMPTTSGEVIAFSSNDGLESWSDSLTSADPVAAASNIGSISGRPVIDGGQVFAISNAGKMASYSLASGERHWAKDISGSQTPWAAGDFVFVISNSRTMMAVSKRNGGVRWSTELPGKMWAGPVLGGGRLLAVSSEGKLVSVSAETGQILTTSDMGGAFYIAPVIANGTVYLLSDDATLIALR
jgi:outer membrane protein assembly factor BamB